MNRVLERLGTVPSWCLDLPMTSACGFAAASAWIGLSRWTGIPFGVAAWVACLLFLATWAVMARRCAARSRADGEPGLPAGLLLPCGAMAVLAATVQHATADDTVYLPMVRWFLDRPGAPLSWDLAYLWTGGPPQSFPWGWTGSAFDFLVGSAAHVSRIPLLWVRNVLAPPVLAALGVLSWMALLRRLGWHPRVRDAVGVALGLAALLLLRESENSPGCALLLRLCQSKMAALYLLLPVAAAAVLDATRRPSPGSLSLALATGLAVSGCSLSAAVIHTVALPAVALAATWAFTSGSVGRRLIQGAAAAAAAGLAPACVTLAAWWSAGDRLGTAGPLHAGYSSSVWAQVLSVFPTILGALVAAAFVHRGLRCAALDGAGRRFLLAWTIGVALLFAGPLLGPVMLDRVIGPNPYWRTLITAPWGILFLAAGIHLARMERPGLSPLAAPALVLVLLALQVPLWLGGLCGTTQYVHPLPDPDRCLNRIAAADVRTVCDLAPDGLLLAPPYLSLITPILDSRHPVLFGDPRILHYFLDGRMRKGHVEDRIAAAKFLEGTGGEDRDAVARILEDCPGVRSVVAHPAAASDGGLAELLATAGFQPVPTGRSDLLLWTR